MKIGVNLCVPNKGAFRIPVKLVAPCSVHAYSVSGSRLKITMMDARQPQLIGFSSKSLLLVFHFDILSHRAINGSKIDPSHRLQRATSFNHLPRIYKTSPLHQLWNRSRSPASREFFVQLPAH